jgi:glucose-6-phosphate 1-epimerase
VHFVEGNAALPKVDLAFDAARAEIYLQGAHITRYQPSAGVDALWMSDSAIYRQGTALRGGIPLCWPWFGADPENSGRPQHGYARTRDFFVASTSADDSATSITLRLDPAQAPYPDWKNSLQLEFEIRLSDSLWLEMRSTNLSQQAVTLSNALHGYFAISARDQVAVPALDGLTYLDKPQDYRPLRHSGALLLDGEIDRVYRAAPALIELLDRGRNITTTIECWGNNNLVIWNPGASKARQMADFDDDGCERMLCIEPANALTQSVILHPGEVHRLGQQIRLDSSA